MAQGELASDFAARRGKTHLAALHSHQAVFLKTSQRHGYCRRRHRKAAAQGSRADGGSFTLDLQDGLRIVLLAAGTHCNSVNGMSSACNVALKCPRLTTTRRTPL